MLTTTIGACINTDTLVINVGTNGIGDLELDNQIVIFPNPSSGMFTISYQGQDGEFQLEIYNVIGELVKHIGSTDQVCTVNITNESAGAYILRVTKGDQMIIRKVVVE
ncbi:MAG: T9SS type A sorting domain-containing protein [Flavobacteriales bacterium]|nr:T9SS type A sorting domain-containing protein [Flavobacteriales bacterium]